MFFFLFYYAAVSTKHQAHGLLGALLLLSLLTRSVAAVDVLKEKSYGRLARRDGPREDKGGNLRYVFLVLFVNVLNSILFTLFVVG
jgi:hypothetical protein